MKLKVCSFFQNYERVLDLMRDIILATDLAHHLKILTDLEKMADGTKLSCLGHLSVNKPEQKYFGHCY